MAWTPQYSAVFEEPIINNTLAIITRDFKAALDYFYPADRLEDFSERALGQVLRNEFPCLAISPRDNPVDEADDDSHLVEAARIDVYVGVTDDGADSVTRKIMKYVRAMDAVLRTAREDFFTGMSNPFGVVISARHAYGPVGGPAESIYFRAAVVELTVSLRER